MTYDLDEAVRGAHAARDFMTTHGIRGTWTNAALVDRALARGVEVSASPRGRVRVSHGGRAYWFSGGRTNFNRPMAKQAARYKEVSSALLLSRGIAAPRNAVFGAEEGARAWQWAEPLSNVVLKPSNANQGKMVHVGITERREFLDVFDTVGGAYGRVLVEQFINGIEHRVAVVDYRVVAATRRVPAHVVGDGVSNVEELTEKKNLLRSGPKNLIHQQLGVDSPAVRELRRQGLSVDSVPSLGEMVYLRSTSNIHTGGDAVDATNDLSPDEVRFVQRAARTFPGLRLAGFDVLLPRSGCGQRPHILEINANPMISMHHYPAEGAPRDVAGRLLDAMFPTTSDPEARDALAAR